MKSKTTFIRKAKAYVNDFSIIACTKIIDVCDYLLDKGKNASDNSLEVKWTIGEHILFKYPKN
jgi:hypothetical protein